MDNEKPRVAIAILRVTPRRDADHEAEAALAEPLLRLAQGLPGFLAVKDFQAADGEVLSLVEWTTRQDLEAWARHPEHVAAKRRHAEFFQDYQLQVCEVVRASQFGRSDRGFQVPPGIAGDRDQG